MNSDTRYLLFTAKVKHGQLLRYLHAAQVRKRHLEQYQLRRQVKSSALTGDPDRVFEVYYADNSIQLQRAREALQKDPLLVAVTKVMDDARVTNKERTAMGQPSLPFKKQDELTQLPYMLSGLGQAQCARLFATKPYLLHVTCILHDINYLDEFNEYMPQLLDNFENHGMTLLVAGQYKMEDQRTRLLNIWEYEDPESPRKLMPQLAENLTYAQLDRLCDQEQHVCRNVSRHYQLYPLLEPSEQAELRPFI